MAYVLCLKQMQVISVTGVTLMMSDRLGPQQVPDQVLPELLARGCVQCDEHGNVLVNGIPLAVGRLTGEEAPLAVGLSRDEQIDAAVQAVLTGADPKNIGKLDGMPLTFAVSELAGFKVSKVEILASVKRLGY